LSRLGCRPITVARPAHEHGTAAPAAAPAAVVADTWSERSFSIGDAVAYGWSAYWRNLASLVLIGIVIIAVNIVFSAAATWVDSIVPQLLIQFVGFLVSMLLALGWIRVSLEVTRGVRPTIGELFRFDGYGPYIGASIAFAIGFYVGLILFVVPGVIFAVVDGFHGFVIAERPGVGVLDSLKESADLTRGHRWQLLGLGIVLLLINFVGVILFVVGLVFTLGIAVIAWAYTYRVLRGEDVAVWS
jgi:uncharacterized membrane protein